MTSLSLGANTWMLIAGAVLLMVGYRLSRWASRRDLKSAAIDTAWTIARGKRTAENPTALEAKLEEIRSAGSTTGQAKRAAGAVAGHFAAQIVNVVAIVTMLVGAVLIALAALWK